MVRAIETTDFRPLEKCCVYLYKPPEVVKQFDFRTGAVQGFAGKRTRFAATFGLDGVLRWWRITGSAAR